MDLNELSLAELKKLQKSVAAAIASFADREKPVPVQSWKPKHASWDLTWQVS